MIRYTIHTEAVGLLAIERIVAELFEGFTLVEGVGCWKGFKEKALTITIYGDANDEGKVFLAASRIRVQNKQETVLVVQDSVSAKFV